MYVALGLLGRGTIPDGEVLSLVWPAAGVAMLMFGLTPPRWWWLVAALVRSRAAGQLPHRRERCPGGGFAVSNVLQGVVAVLLLRALAPHLLGAGGKGPLERLQDFWAVLASCVLAALAGAVVGSVGRGLLGDWTLGDGVVWWARNATGSVALFTTGILALATWQQIRRPGGTAELRASLRARGTEMLLIVTVTLLLYLAFFVDPWLPVAFPLLVPTVWVGLRFAPMSVALHSLAVSAAVVVFTLAGRGPFANLATLGTGGAGLPAVHRPGLLPRGALAIGRGERLALTSTLSTAKQVGPEPGRADVDHHRLDARRGVRDRRARAGRSAATRRCGDGAGLRDRATTSGDSKFVMQTLDGRELSRQDFPWARAMAGRDVVAEDIVMVFDDGSPSRTSPSVPVDSRRPTATGCGRW